MFWCNKEICHFFSVSFLFRDRWFMKHGSFEDRSTQTPEIPHSWLRVITKTLALLFIGFQTWYRTVYWPLPVEVTELWVTHAPDRKYNSLRGRGEIFHTAVVTFQQARLKLGAVGPCVWVYSVSLWRQVGYQSVSQSVTLDGKDLGSYHTPHHSVVIITLLSLVMLLGCAQDWSGNWGLLYHMHWKKQNKKGSEYI